MCRQSAAYNAGCIAERDGKTLADNPYHYFWETEEFYDWNEGWCDSRNEVNPCG